MSVFCVVFYYVVAVSLLIVSIFQYVSGNIGKACFHLIAAGILFILNEIKRNVKVENNYYHCDFMIPPSITNNSEQPTVGDFVDGKISE